jgi:alpha-L-rhamnosidase
MGLAETINIMKNSKAVPRIGSVIKNALPVALIAGAMMAVTSCNQSSFRVSDLEVAFISNISNDPVFSWKTTAGPDVFTQLACQVTVSDDPDIIVLSRGNLWDSRKIETSNSIQFRYEGPELENGKQYFARVRVWDQHDQRSAWSKAARFVVPLEYPGDWQAEWLTYDHDPGAPMPLFRKVFEIPDAANIKYARFYIAAPGYYEASLNGEKIGENVLDPGQTNYEDYTYYTAYDIDPGDLMGENVLGVMLGNGWYNQDQVWKGQDEYAPMVYGQPVFICQLVIQKKNGKRQVISSDESWKWTSGPITYSNVYGGEHYDARLEIGNWDAPGEVSGDWQAVRQPGVHPTRLYEQFAEPIRVMDQIPASRIIDKGDGTYIFDMGQNMAGWLKLRIRGERGQEITVRCTEVLDAEGNIDPRTTGVTATKVIQTQKYICKGGGEEIWEPRFTYFGFRFAEVRGLKQAPAEDLLTGMVIYSSVQEVGSFHCSEENINRLQELSKRTITGNIHSIPTDCPHREKCGWTGDAHAMIRSMICNYGAQRFFNKYMFDMRSSGREEKEEIYFSESFYDRSMVTKPAGVPTMIAPGKRTSGVASPDWGTAMVQIPWYLYIYYGDRMILENFYPDMRIWVEYIQGKKEDGVIPHGLGDWCPPGGNGNIDCPVPVSSTAFHILDVRIMMQVSALLSRPEDQARYAGMFEQLKSDFNRHFLDVDKRTYGSQTADAMALDIGIVPVEYRKEVSRSIVMNIHEEFDGFLNTGIFGLARVFKVLAENGYEDEVYRLLTKTGRNSFAFMWEHYDVTTLWEILPFNDNYSEGSYLRSHNHPMQAGFEAWFYSGIAGINPVADRPGFQLIEFKPYLTRQLDSASASYESGFGTITSKWENLEGKLTWNIRIPENSRGIIQVPTYGSGKKVLLNGMAADVIREDSGFSLIGEYGPGEYLIEI